MHWSVSNRAAQEIYPIFIHDNCPYLGKIQRKESKCCGCFERSYWCCFPYCKMNEVHFLLNMNVIISYTWTFVILWSRTWDWGLTLIYLQQAGLSLEASRQIKPTGCQTILSGYLVNFNQRQTKYFSIDSNISVWLNKVTQRMPEITSHIVSNFNFL